MRELTTRNQRLAAAAALRPAGRESVLSKIKGQW